MHIPSGSTAELELVTFRDALEAANTPNPYYDIDEWELYDLETDPKELNNQYNNPEYAEVREMMHKKLEETRTHYGDSDELNQMYLQRYLDQISAK